MNILTKNLLILASAGSGKTYQLSNRVIGLVALGVDPRTVIALTFTRKAAGEFADEILSKLAKAASDGEVAAEMRAATGAAEADFGKALQEVVRVLPEVMLGTMDSFFARVVRGFQHELGVTGGAFELVEGPVQAAAVDDILSGILRDALGGETGEEFLHAFRRATAGREEQKIGDLVRKFVEDWHGVWRDGVPAAHWGAAGLLGTEEVESWGTVKGRILKPLREALKEVTWTRKGRNGQDETMEKVVQALEDHTTGSGVLGSAPGLFDKIVAAIGAKESGPLELSHYKPFTVGGKAADLLREAVVAVARAEVAAALERTRAIAEIVQVFDAACERRLRRRGMLGFDDVKRLMGEWVQGEEARLRREAVDFRLDARYDHWLLDEFQDTSTAEWTGVVPLLDEAASGEDSSLFIVGDKKQAIYGWRGGEVRLFDEVEARYGDGLETETMPVSYRSCPEVLALVNAVCGDKKAIAYLFGEDVAGRWEWEDHESAEKLREPGRRGQARVEVVDGGKTERHERMVEVMREVGIGTKNLTCGVLVRTNPERRAVADFLRAEGYDVVEEGRRHPSADNSPGLAMRYLIEWLAHPADQFAREVVAMSPFEGVLRERFGEAWQASWEGLLDDAAENGLAGMAEGLVEPLWDRWSLFGRRRAGDIIGALQQVDAVGGTVRDAARMLADLEVAQAPGVAAVQVMTIHKAKGLGFDVVMLPEIPDEQVPNRGHFKKAAGEGWVTETPADWAREFVPGLQEAETAWAAKERYEALCVFYVALTRAKRGLYAFLSVPPKGRKGDEPWRSMAEWMRRSCDCAPTAGVAWTEGENDWIGGVEDLEIESTGGEAPALGEGIARRERKSPSGAKARTGGGAGSPGGMLFGSAVHAEFEKIGWIEEDHEALGSGDAAEVVRACLEEAEIRSLFTKRDGVEVRREVPMEVILDGAWMSGVVDRLHVARDGEGAVTGVEVIDFKTDAVESAAELLDRYRGQMEAYREALATILGVGPEVIRCVLVWTKGKEVVEL